MSLNSIEKTSPHYRFCEVCNKRFYIHAYVDYAYTTMAVTGEDGTPGQRYFCSYTCMREWEKAHRPSRIKPWMLDREGQEKRLQELLEMINGDRPLDGKKKDIKEDIHDLRYWLGYGEP